MERMLVVVFDDEAKAYEATRALNQLDAEGSISVYAQGVISKNADGSTTVKQADGDFPIRTLTGTAIGSLIGLLAGPVGAGIGALAGTFAGSVGDLYVAGIDADFLGEVSAALKPGKHAVIADVSEEWVTPVDSQMEVLKGVVFRTTRKSFEQEQRAREVAEVRAEMDQLKAEHAAARAERKAKLQAKIEALRAKLENKMKEARHRSEQMKSETDAKVQCLQQKAAKTQGDMRAAMDARAMEIEREYEQSLARLESMTH